MPTATKSRYLVLIPAYKPDERLVTLVETLIARGLPVLVVDDGGQEKFLHIFTRCEQAGASVARHAVNMGKGRALKTGLNEIMLRYPDVLGVVTADADGQHTPDDIERVIAAMAEHPRALVLGLPKNVNRQVKITIASRKFATGPAATMAARGPTFL